MDECLGREETVNSYLHRITLFVHYNHILTTELAVRTAACIIFCLVSHEVLTLSGLQGVIFDMRVLSFPTPTTQC